MQLKTTHIAALKKTGNIAIKELPLKPLFWISILTLFINDAFLKSSGIIPSVITGKLSDLAGLFFFPLLLISIFKPEKKALVHFSFFFTALLFSLLNLPFLYENITQGNIQGGVNNSIQNSMSNKIVSFSLAGFPVAFWPDYEDLLTLPALLLSWLYYKKLLKKESMPPSKNKKWKNWAAHISLAGAVAASLHTSIVTKEQPTTPAIMYKTATVGYPETGFRDGFITNNTDFYFAQPSGNRIIRLLGYTHSSSLAHNGTTFSWSTLDSDSPATNPVTIGFDAPRDLIYNPDPLENALWVIDNNFLRKFDFNTGQLQGEYPFPAGFQYLQVELLTTPVVLAKDIATGAFFLYFLDNQANLLWTYALPTIQMESARAIIDIKHFKIDNGHIYLLYQLATLAPTEEFSYFLENILSDGTLNNITFKSGLFFYNAAALSCSSTEILVNGRQRNYDTFVTKLDFDLNRTTGYTIENDLLINGQLLLYPPYPVYVFNPESYIFLNFNGAIETYEIYEIRAQQNSGL